MTRLLIARHGNTFAPDEKPRRVGKTDLPLVESGLIQGRLLGLYLKKVNLIPTVIYTSELKRTKQTASEALRALARDIPLQALTIFNEIDYGPDENRLEAQVRERLGEQALKNWDEKALVPEGWNFDPQQTIADLQQFAKKVEVEYLGQTILVITSNGIARFAPYLTGDFFAFTQQHQLKMATGSVAIFEKEQKEKYWRCSAWNIKPAAQL